MQKAPPKCLITQRCCLLLMVAALVTIFLAAIASVIVVMTKQTAESLTTTSTITSTTATTATTTTVTTATTTTSTSTTTTTGSTTSITSTLTTATTTVTTTTATTTTTTATTTTASVTTSSTSATTSTSSSTSTSTTTSTTSTTAFSSCTGLQWNQTGVSVAGTGSDTTNSNGFKHPSWLYVDANGTLYVCDQQNSRVQMWINGATNGATVAGSSTGAQGSTSTLLQQPLTLTLDDNGFLYVSDQHNNRVQRYPPNSLNGTTVAGQGGGGSNALNDLHNPTGIDVDNNSNLYIADKDNNRLMLWAPNATTGTILISDNLISHVYGLLLKPGSSNQVYLSSQDQHSIYLWTFGASNPNVTLTQVSGSTNTLNNPSGITVDPYGNLYVADRDNNRVVMYCVNSTVGTTVVGGSGSTSPPNHPIGVGFDSKLNLYVATDAGDNVVRYALL